MLDHVQDAGLRRDEQATVGCEREIRRQTDLRDELVGEAWRQRVGRFAVPGTASCGENRRRDEKYDAAFQTAASCWIAIRTRSRPASSSRGAPQRTVPDVIRVRYPTV